jgi:hypothetical protein
VLHLTFFILVRSTRPFGPESIERKGRFSQVFAGQKVGIKEVPEKIWLVTFMQYDLGFFDEQFGSVECAENPFGAKLLPMSTADGIICYP